MPSIHITTAKLEDARQVAEIHVTTWQSAYQGVLSAECLASLSVDEREAMWRESIVKGVPELFVAKVEGGMVGWVAFGPCRDEGSLPDCAEVWAIYVAPPSWSSGVGRRLWRGSRARMLEQGFETVSAWGSRRTPAQSSSIVLPGSRPTCRRSRNSSSAASACRRFVMRGGSNELCGADSHEHDQRPLPVPGD